MRGEKDPKRLEALRQRLYERGVPDKETKESDKQSSTDEEASSLPTDWQPGPKKTPPIKPPVPPQPETPINMPSKKRQSLRIKIIILSLVFFVGAVALSSLFILIGGNTISGDNIAISLNGPFTVGGGEVMDIQVGIVNENNISIESAILVIDYPKGSRTVSEEGEDKELFTERIPLNKIESGESVNIPIKMRVFGEENEDMTVNASVEYRVSGSNSTFYKQAKPLRFKVSSSPVVVSMESLSSLASGQEAEVEVKIISNSNADIENLLLRLEYPGGFEFISADPSPDSGRNAWLIDSLEPEEVQTITIKGIALGADTDTQVIRASIGSPSDRDSFNLSSVLNTASLEYEIEQPFVVGSISINNNSTGPVSIANNSDQTVTVRVVNNLTETIYNGVVKVSLSGNALRYTDISGSGFYDSNNNTVTWDVSSVPGLSEMAPGEGESMTFSISPQIGNLTSGQLNIKASFAARRSSPTRVQETLTDSLALEVRVRSEANLIAGVGHNNGIFTDKGPIPPEVGEETSYTISMQVQSGSNGLGSNVVSAILPTYMTWLDNVKGDGSVTYDPSSRKMEWDAGTIGANGQATVSFNVSILPSSSQIGTTPILVGTLSLRAVDLYTDDIVTATHGALTAEMSSESGYGFSNGVVQN